MAVSRPEAAIDHRDVEVVVIATAHDSHEELVTRALATGRHVWCEKPLALTSDGLDAVEKAWRESGRELMTGFNRRWSPAVQAAQAALARLPAPKLLVYRVAAGRVPAGHWYRDRRHGGRLIGEVCHFVDTAQALVGSAIEGASAVVGGGPGALAGEDSAVALRFADGSLATIAYGSAEATAGKEWIEVLAGSHRIVIEDFRRLQLDERTLWKGHQDKGHRAAVTAFYRAIKGGPALPTESMLATMRMTVRASELAGTCD